MQSSFEKIVNTKPKHKGRHRKTRDELREAKRTRREVKRNGGVV